MTATPFDSAILHKLFPTGDLSRLFSDSAEVRAMLLVEGALAKAQGAAGMIPEISAQAIHRATLELQVDPGGLAEATAQNGVSVPALVSATRDLMQAPEHAQYLHWGATSQDIQDTGLTLRLKQVLRQYEDSLSSILRSLARLAAEHAETPMVARTYGQAATLTSFGATVASWGAPLLTLHRDMADLRSRVLWVSLSGASGTAAELGPDPAALRAALAEALGLTDPQRSWHSDRSPILALAHWCGSLTAHLGKLSEDLLLATQTGYSEVTLGGLGSSSTMPQKQNPVAPSAIVALARHAQGLCATLQGAAQHRQQRDGAAWFTEWLTLPQLCLTTGSTLLRTDEMLSALQVNTKALQRGIDQTDGMIYAEALSFVLARRQPRPEAQTEVKALCRACAETGQTLPDAARSRWNDLPETLFTPSAHLGTAPTEARAFAQEVTKALAD